MTVLAIVLVGAATGFLGGLFGKGGSAVATPVLAALGVPPLVAVASPLPATIPGTLLAGRQYARRGLVDRSVTAWCIAVGLPATVAGALLTRWIPGESLVTATDVLVGGLGIGILVGAGRARARRSSAPAAESDVRAPAADVDGRAGQVPQVRGGVATAVRTRLSPDPAVVAVAAGVGLTAGLLANSGGFLLAPLLLVVLRLPVRMALGTSLVVSAALAVPGALTHAALGHVDPGFVLLFGAASVPLSALGARTALRIDPARLELGFGAALVLLSASLLAWA